MNKLAMPDEFSMQQLKDSLLNYENDFDDVIESLSFQLLSVCCFAKDPRALLNAVADHIRGQPIESIMQSEEKETEGG